MRIGIEADRMWASQFGVGRFVREAVRALRTACREHEYVLFSLTHSAQAFRRFYSPVRLMRGARRLMWLQTGLPWQAARAGVNVLFCPDYLIPIRAPCPVVAMVHDLLFTIYPEWGEDMVNWQLKLCLPMTIHRAAQIVTPSEFIRQELIQTFRCKPEKVTVVPAGVDERFQPRSEEDVKSALARYQLDGTPFILSVGMWSPRKNLTRLLQAFVALRHSYPGKLVLVGGGGWSRRPLLEAIRALGVADRVELVGFVPDEDLPAFYSAADLFVFPSLYEGFGLPLLEAMACGCPVIASNAASIPEVANGAAKLVDPYDVSGLAHAIREVVQDSSQTAHLRERGIRHAQRFQWAKTAKQLLAVFEAVAA